jgi:hypothetical protein
VAKRRGAPPRGKAAGEQPVSQIIPKLFTVSLGEEVVKNKAFPSPAQVTAS